jgi:ribosome biogenesis GTPase A
MKRIYLIDCPGIVYPSPDDSDTDIVLKGVVRVENITAPEDYIPALLERVKPEYIKRTYELESWEDHTDFLTQLAKKSGKLLKVCHNSIEIFNFPSFFISFIHAISLFFRKQSLIYLLWQR